MQCHQACLGLNSPAHRPLLERARSQRPAYSGLAFSRCCSHITSTARAQHHGEQSVRFRVAVMTGSTVRCHRSQETISPDLLSMLSIAVSNVYVVHNTMDPTGVEMVGCE
jgi:hypothetical protein